MRLFEITDDNQVIIALKGLRLYFNKEVNNAKAIEKLTSRMSNATQKANFKPMLDALIKSVDLDLAELLQLDQEDADVMDAIDRASKTKLYIQNVINGL